MEDADGIDLPDRGGREIRPLQTHPVQFDR